MAKSSSSTKKAAKLASQRTGSAGPRFQGGVFPIAMMLVIVIGVATIVWARSTKPDGLSEPPTINDHWHAAYGIDICGTWYQFAGNLEDRDASGLIAHPEFARTGIHSHDDGVVHWHPYSSAATGTNAKLKVFLDNYDAKLSDDKFSIGEGTSLIDPETGETITGPEEWVEGEYKCGEEPMQISLQTWDNYADTENARTYTADMDQVRITKDSMVFSIYLTAADQEHTEPPWTSKLPELGSVDAPAEDYKREDLDPTASTIDANQIAPSDSTSSGATGDGTDSGSAVTTAPGATSPATTGPAATSPATTVAVSEAPETTAG